MRIVECSTVSNHKKEILQLPSFYKENCIVLNFLPFSGKGLSSIPFSQSLNDKQRALERATYVHVTKDIVIH